MGNTFECAVERIKVIDFNKEELRKNSVTMLFIEYLRRMSVFLKYINNNESISRLFLVQASREIGNNLEIDVEKYRPDIYKVNYYLADNIFQFYLEWCALIDDGNVTALRFSDIYEPLIKFVEIGGKFSKEHGILDVYNCTIWQRYDFGKANFEPIDISEHSLRLYDEMILGHRVLI